MEFKERILALASRAREIKEHTATEEATKNALILPFLQALGYDTFDPRIVIPEYVADVGKKKGEKVDYAIIREGVPVIFIEAKNCGACLDSSKASQLLRYFNTTTTARIAILTDGIVYKFFSDLDEKNIMDENPFMIFNFLNPEEALIPELKKLANDKFDIEETLSAAQDLKHTRQLKQKIADEFSAPSDALTKILAKDIHPGNFRPHVLDSYKTKIKTAFAHYINDILNERLLIAMKGNEYAIEEKKENEKNLQTPSENRIVTTQDELEAYFIIKSILREKITPERISIRDSQSYCAILLDDNNRKTICRLHFNTKQKSIGFLDIDKKEHRIHIASIDDIYRYAKELHASVEAFAK